MGILSDQIQQQQQLWEEALPTVGHCQASAQECILNAGDMIPNILHLLVGF